MWFGKRWVPAWPKESALPSRHPVVAGRIYYTVIITECHYIRNISIVDYTPLNYHITQVVLVGDEKRNPTKVPKEIGKVYDNYL